MASSTVEDYIKRIYLQQQQAPDAYVPLGRLATDMQVVPGTATAMVKTLSEAGLVDYQPRIGVQLTPNGNKLALHVLRRHRLLELFLVQILQYDWSEVHEEAEILEHVVSDKMLERIDQLLGHPSVDPHGDPIPNSKGAFPVRHLTRLNEIAPDEAVRISRIVNQEPEFLRFIERSGLTPGSEITIDTLDDLAGSLTLTRKDGESLNLGLKAAASILVDRGE
ncbi:MAG: DtxR family Mn-dependent transcriptional regulator [Kiritimatiellia bacterium]|jgi:DtxR family transcriptional regulator, Mn-dependent transcriptional regulator